MGVGNRELVELLKAVEEGLGFRFEPEQSQATQDSGNAQPVVVRRRPDLGDTIAEVVPEHHLPIFRQGQAPEFQHAHEGMSKFL